MEIKAGDVKTLRDKTGAGMLDCKKALVDSGGDFDKAIKILKELGLAAAAKRSGRATNHGRIFTAVTEKKAGLLEFSCETDFVARNNDFIATGEKMLSLVLDKDLMETNDELETMVKDLISTIKENMGLKRFMSMNIAPNELVCDYLHGEGSIGVLVKFSSDKPEILASQSVKDFAFDCALHIAAFNPVFLSRDTVDPAYLAEQQDIFRKQALNLGKPENVLEGIAKGKLAKHLSEVCFLEQPFVKDDKISVAKALELTAKEAGGNLAIADYAYYRVGEEI